MLSKVSDVFNIEYGNKLDANKLVFVDKGVNFVSRSSKNLGIVGQVEPVEGVTLYPPGVITVTLGGTYLLSSFVQPKPFYTAQNIKVLTPKEEMSFKEKVYLCKCIQANRFRYSTHGREANRSIDDLLLPSRHDLPEWLGDVKIGTLSKKQDHESQPYIIPTKTELVELRELFDFTNGVMVPESARSAVKESEEFFPYIRPSKSQVTCFVEYVDGSAVDPIRMFPRHTLYVSTNGQGSHTYAYVSTEIFVANSDVTILTPKRTMSLQEKIFFAAAITYNRFKFSYGRKPKGARLRNLLVPNRGPQYIYENDLVGKIVSKK